MKNKQTGRNIAIIGAVSVLVLVVMVEMDGAANLLQAVLSVRLRWLFAVLCMMAFYWLMESQILHLAVRRFYPRQRFMSTVKTSMIGQFFNCVTPFASGGQPVQAYHLTRCGVPLGTASCALMIKFIVYQSVLTLYSLVTLIMRFGMFKAEVSGFAPLVLVGFGVNAAVIAGLVSLCCFPRATRGFLRFAVRALARVRLIKAPDAAYEKLDKELAGFYEGFAVMGRHISLIVQMAVLTVLQLTAMFLIPWALYRSFGLAGASALSILAAGAFVLNLTSFVPLPGAAGGAELGFHMLFAMFFPARLLAASILLWRAATFYLPICMGSFFTVSLNASVPKAKSGGISLPAA